MTAQKRDSGRRTEIGATERRSPSPILIILALDFLFLFWFFSLTLCAVGCASGVDPPQSFKTVLPNALFNPTYRRPGPPTSAGRKAGGLLSFTFWLFMSISITSLAPSSFPSPVYGLLGFHSMVYATVCFLAVLAFGQSTRSGFSWQIFFIPRIFHPSTIRTSSYTAQSYHLRYLVAEDRPESPSLTPLLFQLISQTPPSRHSAPTSPSKPSDATSPISMIPLPKIQNYPAYTIHRTVLLPTVPGLTPFILGFILQTVHP